MPAYKHTQIGYLTIGVTLVVFLLFVWVQIMARAELPSVDSGANFAVSAMMVLIVLVLSSFTALTVTVDEQHVAIRFGYGIFRKKFAVSDIADVKQIKNHWYYGWGIRLWFWPRMWVYNVSGFDAIALRMKNGKLYRIGTDEPEKLAAAMARVITR